MVVEKKAQPASASVRFWGQTISSRVARSVKHICSFGVILNVILWHLFAGSCDSMIDACSVNRDHPVSPTSTGGPFTILTPLCNTSRIVFEAPTHEWFGSRKQVERPFPTESVARALSLSLSLAYYVGVDLDLPRRSVLEFAAVMFVQLIR